MPHCLFGSLPHVQFLFPGDRRCSKRGMQGVYGGELGWHVCSGQQWSARHGGRISTCEERDDYPTLTFKICFPAVWGQPMYTISPNLDNCRVPFLTIFDPTSLLVGDAEPGIHEQWPRYFPNIIALVCSFQDTPRNPSLIRGIDTRPSFLVPNARFWHYATKGSSQAPASTRTEPVWNPPPPPLAHCTGRKTLKQLVTCLSMLHTTDG